MVEWLLWAAFAVPVNTLIGYVVLCCVDDAAHRLSQWFQSCPPQVGWFMGPLALNAWPMVLWFW